MMKEKRRRRSTRLIEMTKNITESKVIDMVGAPQAEVETKNEAVGNPLPMPLVLPATTKTRDVNVEPKISPPPIMNGCESSDEIEIASLNEFVTIAFSAK